MKEQPYLNPSQKALVENNLNLSHYLSQLVWRKNKNKLDLEEIVSIAYQGLCDAALRWNPEEFEYAEEDLESGKGFSSYARTRILGSILDWQRGSDHVQRSYRTTYKNLCKAGYGQLQLSEEELAEKIQEPVAKVRAVIRAVESTPVSIDELIVENWDSPTTTLGVESSALVATINQTVADTYWTLPEIQKYIIAMRYYANMELQTISAELGLSLTQVREAHVSAVITIQNAMRERVQDDYNRSDNN